VDLPVHAGDLAAQVSDFFAVAEVLVQDLHGMTAVEFLQRGGDASHFFT
jgi:hypothetical protein